MDCIIPHHSVRMFCAAIGACSKIGKDLYVDFDAIDGLCLRTLNEAKSAYVCYKFHPTFFARCTAPSLEILETSRKRKNRSQQSTADSDEDDDGTTTTHDDHRFTCRLAIKALAAAVRQRKNVQSLRLYVEQVASSLHLSFEYLLASAALHDEDDGGTTCWRVVHRVPVADFPVAVVSAVASATGASEMVVAPRTLCRLLEPLARQAETAWMIPSPAREAQMVATCFQHQAAGAASNHNALWTSHLQTEMRLSYDDLDEMEFVDNRDDDQDEDMPENVNESVVLVFSHREAKAILSWAASAEHLACPSVRVLFHWGGRPVVLRQETNDWKVELVLATLDHKILGTMNE